MRPVRLRCTRRSAIRQNAILVRTLNSLAKNVFNACMHAQQLCTGARLCTASNATRCALYYLSRPSLTDRMGLTGLASNKSEAHARFLLRTAPERSRIVRHCQAARTCTFCVLITFAIHLSPPSSFHLLHCMMPVMMPVS